MLTKYKKNFFLLLCFGYITNLLYLCNKIRKQMIAIGKNTLSAVRFYSIIWGLMSLLGAIIIMLMVEIGSSKPEDIKVKETDKILVIDRWVVSLKTIPKYSCTSYGRFYTVRDTFPKRLIASGTLHSVFENERTAEKFAKIKTSKGIEVVKIAHVEYMYMKDRQLQYIARKCRVEELDYPLEGIRRIVFQKSK